jgi:hypothetical protein
MGACRGAGRILTAAAEAFPFTAEAAHRLCTLELSRTRHILLTALTQNLAHALETWMRPRASGLSLDSLQQLRDHAWFADAPDTRPLAHLLRDLARPTLETSGGSVMLCRHGDLPERLNHFRWLSLLLPPDLLIAALPHEPTADRVTLVSAHLGQVLREHPVAETHLHLGAALSFGHLWTGLTRELAEAAPRANNEPRPLAKVIAADPLARWLPHAPGRALPETRFAARAIRYLLGVGAKDKVFAQVFWQYQRVRSGLYRYLVMEPGTAGLDWFQRFYNRISPLRKALWPAAFESALALEGSCLRLGALEVRWAPDRGAAEVRESLRGVARSAQREAAQAAPGLPQPPEVGVVLHFLKERELKIGRPGRLHADPRQIAHGARFGAFAYARLVEAIAIATALDRNPELLLVLRGLDVASTELSVPTWAMLPAIGDMLSVEEHPSFQLQPLVKGCVAPEGAVLLSLNADDPLTFATSLADEFAYLYGALLRQKVPASEALAWLGHRRDQGFRSRFTLGVSRSPRALGALARPPLRGSNSSLSSSRARV